MSYRSQVLSLYRTLLRTTQTVFGEDVEAVMKARVEIRSQIHAQRDVTDKAELEELILILRETDRVLRYGVLQGKLNERGNYQVTIPAGLWHLQGTLDLECASISPPAAAASAPVFDFQRAPYLTHIAEEFSVHSKGNIVHDNYLKGCKWAPDGTCILTNSADSSLRLFNVPDLNSLPAEPRVWASALNIKEVDLVYDYCWYPKMSSSDQATSCFLTTARTAPIHLWDAFSGALRASYIPKNSVDAVVAANSVAIDPSGVLIVAGFTNCVRVYDISRPGEDCDLLEMSTKNGRQGGIISCIAFDPSGVDLMALGSYNRSVGVYSLDGDLVSRMADGHHTGGITHARFSADGRRLFTGARSDSSIFCWDLRTNKPLYQFRRNASTNQRVYFDLDPTETLLCSGQIDGSLLVWNLSGLPATEAVHPIEASSTAQLHTDMVNGVSFHPLWTMLATASGQRHVPLIAAGVDDSDDETEGASTTAVMKGAVDSSLKLWPEEETFSSCLRILNWDHCIWNSSEDSGIRSYAEPEAFPLRE
ncbi:Telomerase Cajal body protein 1 [Hypsibius exemplaris]|uniref:Complex III assembly factor LYRM7 n=1 Tax=Hypsibius exemplaris TaxID=2072580 RepID=A0A9X6RNR2_HYPEX|nr:Telomerase Cajal body protein 1 [Hypsibius exemplaris]